MTSPGIGVPPSEIAAQAGATALVTGGAGFIGSRLCDLLAAAGWVVHTVSRRATGTLAAHRHWPLDLTDAAATSGLMKAIRPDYVFHLASHVWGAPDLKHVLPTFHANLQTTVNLLVALAEIGCRGFVTTGSLAEPYPRTPGDFPAAPYAVAKSASSDYVRMFHALYQVPGVIARVFMVYGPAQQDKTKLIPYVIERLLRGQSPEITSGRRSIDWIYVDDVTRGLALTALAPGIAGRTVDLGSGTLITTADLVQKICDLIGGERRPILGAVPDRPLEPVRVARVEETQRLIGWSPQTRLEEGLGRTIAWYRDDASARVPRMGIAAVTAGRSALS
jgi:nucleoside-diphosphate-sugar epimerase